MPDFIRAEGGIRLDVLIGTTNPSKVDRLERLLEGRGVHFLTLRDLHVVEEPAETGRSPEENARIKAAFYGRFFDPVICNDSGLYFDGLPIDDPRQPGLHVRSPEGKRLDDDEMIEYYAALIRGLGGKVLAYYLDGLAVCKGGRVESCAENDPEGRSGAFYMVDHASPLRHAGWPLDSLSIDPHTNAYFVDPAPIAPPQEPQRLHVTARHRRVSAFLARALGL